MHVALLGAVFEYLKEKKLVKVDIQKLSESIFRSRDTTAKSTHLYTFQC